ncbi:MAG: hypothetical protein H6715_05655 [Myxococcales bacterium]|nr:hypothetical protein [Myxococcales bacterium]
MCFIACATGCGRIGFDRHFGAQDASFEDGKLQDTPTADGPTPDGTVECEETCNGTAGAWVKAFGGSSSDYGIAVDTDSANNVYIAASFIGTVDFGGGAFDAGLGQDIIVAGFDPLGAHRWSIAHGGLASGPWYGHAIIADLNDDIFFLGTPYGPDVSSYVSSYEQDGAYRWGGPTWLEVAKAQGLSVDAQSRIYVTGSFSQDNDFGCGATLQSQGSTDVFIASYDSATGACIWAQRYGGASSDSATDIVAAADGTTYVTGSFRGGLVAGSTTYVSRGGTDVFVSSYDGDGNHRWTITAGDAQNDIGYQLALAGNNQLVVAGSFTGTIDFGFGELTAEVGSDIFVASFDGADGQVKWASRIGGSSAEFPADLQVGPNGLLYLCGNYYDTVSFLNGELHTSNGESDAFVLAYQLASGAPTAAVSYGGTGSDGCADIAFDDTGTMLVIGSFEDAVDFGGTVLNAQGPRDIFLLKTQPPSACACP